MTINVISEFLKIINYSELPFFFLIIGDASVCKCCVIKFVVPFQRVVSYLGVVTKTLNFLVYNK